MKILFSARAFKEIGRHAQWWRAHRDAKQLFEEELAAALTRIRTNPDAGQLYRVSRGREQRRVLMPKTARHLYYRQEGDTLFVLSVWGARRAHGPKL